MARSPNYPAITPAEAIEDAKALWQKHQRSTVTPEEVAQTLGYKGLSGASRPRLAALKKYGIVEKRGKGLALSDRAITFAIRQPDSPQYRAAIRDAVMDVSLFAGLLRTHQNASQRMVREHLIADLAFTEDGADRAAEAFFASKTLLSDQDSGTVGGQETPKETEGRDDDPPVVPSEGDFVQWTSQDVARFEQPRKVLGLSEDGEYAFVEGTTTGIPVSELTIEKPPENDTTPPPPKNPFAGRGRDLELPETGTKQDVFALDSGEVLVRWPDSLTENDYDDIKDWLTILERKIGRSVKPPEKPDDN